ncbi:hypothetical protein [Saccharibacillus sacchari]|uniref:Uncharacterized protein n=1 Tax=Saccharibacillus sacchari TaxID=456493 RepID=A0ACC6PAS0_9BACL
MTTLEQQLDKLAALGIAFHTPKPRMLDRLTRYYDANFYEQDPYMRLLPELGTGLSANIWRFDLECAEDADIYEQYIARMIGLSEGMIEISDLHGKFDPTESATRISFVYEEKRHEISAMNQGDWFDLFALGSVQNIVQGPDRRFVHHVQDQTVTVLFCNDDARQQLQELTNGAYGPLI